MKAGREWGVRESDRRNAGDVNPITRDNRRSGKRLTDYAHPLRSFVGLMRRVRGTESRAILNGNREGVDTIVLPLQAGKKRGTGGREKRAEAGRSFPRWQEAE